MQLVDGKGITDIYVNWKVWLTGMNTSIKFVTFYLAGYNIEHFSSQNNGVRCHSFEIFLQNY